MNKSIVFTPIEGSVAITRMKGVYKQTQAYLRKNQVYIKDGGGFVRVYAMYGKNWYNTTKVDLIVEDLDLGEIKLVKGKLGILTVKS